MRYDSMHAKIKRERGHANGYACIKCEKQARDWALIDSTPEELLCVDPVKNQTFCLDVNQYQPMCRSCHLKMDRPNWPEESKQRQRIKTPGHLIWTKVVS